MKKGWEYKKLGEVCEIIGGGTPSKKNESYYLGCIPWASVRDMNVIFLQDTEFHITQEALNDSSSHIIKKGEVIIATRVGLGKVCLLTQDTAINQDLKGLVPKHNNINRVFLYYWYNSIADYVISQGVGATVQGVKLSVINNLSIPVPPLSEQEEIVRYLDSAFEKIDELKKNAEQQLTESKALFQKALSEYLSPKKGWEERKLGDVCEIFGRIGFRGYTRKDLVSSDKEGAITLSPSNIQDFKMDYSSCSYISWFKYEESPEIKIYNGDVLLVKTGSSYGKSALVENLPHPATINPQSVVLKNFKVNNRFFAYLLRTNWIRKKFDEFVSGTAIPTFSQANLSTVLMHFPPLAEQQAIVEKLDTISAHCRQLEENYRQTIALCDDLKQKILKQIFES